MPQRTLGVLALLLLLPLASACSTVAWPGYDESTLKQDSTVSADATRESAPDFVAIREMLAKRARAIERGDRRAFLQSLDPGNAELRRSQLVLFRNLQELPLGSISYRSGDFSSDEARVPGNAPTLRPNVTEVVELRGVDRRPAANELEMTFVRRGDDWLLAVEQPQKEEEFLADRPASRPWFGTRIDVALRGRMLVATDRQSPSVADLLASRTEQHLADISSRLGVANDSAVLVDATSTGLAHEMNEDEEAAAVFFAASAPDGRHVAGWRIKINPENIDDLLDDEQLLRHELTHFVARKFIRVSPTWVREGLAEYVSWQPYGIEDLVFDDRWAARFRKAVREIPTSGQFRLNPEINYPVSFAAVTALMNVRGIAGIKELAKGYARAARGTDDFNADWASGEVLRRTYGFGIPQLTGRAWNLVLQQL